MAKLGTEKRPVRFHVQTEERLEEIAAICEEHGWKFIGGYEPDDLEDIREVEYLLNPDAFQSQPRIRLPNHATVVHEAPQTGRNDPCPCGSGLKHKKCCMT